MMKFKNYALLLAMCAVGFQSCDDNDDESIPVPAELQKAFSEMYPSANEVKWENKGQYYVADFRNNSYDASAWYTTNGQWHMTETDVPYTALPQKVKDTFEASEYSKTPWRIDDVDMLERHGIEVVYIIEIENKDQEKDLYYSTEGILIKTVDDVDNDDSTDYLPPIQLPVAMKKFIDERYPNASIMEIDIEDDRDEPDFGYTEIDIIHDGIAKEVVFDKNSTWVYTKKDISVRSLPEAIKNKVMAENQGYTTIDDVEYYETESRNYYLIELEGPGKPDKKVEVMA